jgi:hypothetical protein
LDKRFDTKKKRKNSSVSNDKPITTEGNTAGNSTYKKLAVQWLNEVQFFNQTFVQVDSFVLRNRQLLIAAKRYLQV